MKRALVLVALLAVSTVVLAAVAHMSWDAPTQNTDNTAVPATGPGSIVSYTAEVGPCNAARDALTSVTQTITTPGLMTDSQDLGPGTWCAHVKATNTYGQDSAWSNVGNKVVAPPTPKPPTNFSIN